MTQSIRTQINLLRNTKSGLRQAIMEKGVTVQPSDLFSTYPTRISQISSTAGTYSDDLKKLLDGSFTSYDIPDGTERIRYAAFEGYSSLTSVTIPASVTYINERAFMDCTSLQSITCLAQTPPSISYTVSTQAPFYNTNNCPIYVPDESVDTYKAASGWRTYASRIHPISTPVFRLVTQLSDMTDGDYLLAYEDTNAGVCYALNASLLPVTTSSSNGLNASPNSVTVNSLGAGEILADSTSRSVMLHYDATNKYLTRELGGDVYYLSCYRATVMSGTFTYSGTTTPKTITPYQYTDPADNTFVLVKDGTKTAYLFFFTSSLAFQWRGGITSLKAQFYKLVE